MILKFFQDFLKSALFFNLLIYLSIFLKSTCLLLDIFLKFIFSQKEKYSFIWTKTVDFLFLKHSIFYPENNSCSLEFLFFFGVFVFIALLRAICLNFLFSQKKSVVLFSPNLSVFYFKIIKVFVQQKEFFFERCCPWI